MLNNVIPFRAKPQHILQLIRDLSQDSGRILIAPAAQMQFDRRMVSMRQVVNCLRNGRINQGPYLDDYGLTCCEMEWMTGGALVRVVVSISGRTPNGRVLHILFAEEV